MASQSVSSRVLTRKERRMLEKQNKEVPRSGSYKQNMNVPKWIIPFILILTFLAFIPVLQAGFVNWDDPDYVSENILVKDLSNLGKLLTTPLQGNHHPLTMLSLAINFQLFGEEAWSFHLINLLLHLVNCVLVFQLAMVLSRKNVIIAFTTAIFFGIHPLHVESVAWISERKDVLYTLFFVAGLISYTKYADTNSKKQYWLTILFALLSTLSKAAAVVFPLALFCIDLLRQRKFNLKLVIEKIPFFVFAIIMGLLTYLAQKESGSVGDEVFGFGERILFGFYGIMMYLFKLIIPIHQSPFYPFPPFNESLPAEYYISPLVSVALAFLFFYSLKRYREISFGIAFYIVNLLLVLQVMSVGSAVISERYTYVPYIGIFYIIGWLISRYVNKDLLKANRIIIPVSLVFAFITFQQTKMWDNSLALWNKAAKNNPSSRAYSALGVLYKRDNDFDKALEYYNRAIKINAIDNEALTNRGNIFFEKGNFDIAYYDYKQALTLKPDYYPALDNLGAVYAIRGQYDSSLILLNHALAVKPDYKPAYRNRGYTYMQLKKYDEAIKDFQSFLFYEPNAADVINTIGNCLRGAKKYNESLEYINKAISLKQEPAFYMNRSYTHFELKNIEAARQDALTAKNGGVQVEPGYANRLGIQ